MIIIIIVALVVTHRGHPSSRHRPLLHRRDSTSWRLWNGEPAVTVCKARLSEEDVLSIIMISTQVTTIIITIMKREILAHCCLRLLNIIIILVPAHSLPGN